jgi:transcriptional regulator with XRE-family HTH domain
MIVANPVDLGLLARSERRRRRLSQSQLCAAADVSRRWLSDFETGKATAEIGLAFRVLHALGLVLEVSGWPSPDLDLDDVIRAYGHRTETS